MKYNGINVRTVILNATTPEELTDSLNEVSNTFNIVHASYTSGTIEASTISYSIFSVLLFVKEEK